MPDCSICVKADECIIRHRIVSALLEGRDSKGGWTPLEEALNRADLLPSTSAVPPGSTPEEERKKAARAAAGAAAAAALDGCKRYHA